MLARTQLSVALSLGFGLPCLTDVSMARTLDGRDGAERAAGGDTDGNFFNSEDPPGSFIHV